MKFSLTNTAIAALAVCNHAVLGALTASEIVSNIQTLTDESQALQEPATSITVVNGPLVIVGQGPIPQIIEGFGYIVSNATNSITDIEGTEQISATADGDAIFEAYRDFVRASEQLLNILIGKSGLLQTVPIAGAPLVARLRQVEQVIDAFTFSLVDIVESRAADLQTQLNTFDMKLETAVESYSGI